MKTLHSLIQALPDLAFPQSCLVCGRPLALDKPRPPAGPESFVRDAAARYDVCAHARPLCPECCGRLLRPSPGPRCPGCGSLLVSESGLCMRCRVEGPYLDGGFRLLSYTGAVRELLEAYKFGGRRSLARPFAAMIFSAIRSSGWLDYSLVPVPPRRGKIRERGWDQVEELARRLSAMGQPVARCLERSGGRQQKRLDRKDRIENAIASYRTVPRSAIPPRALLLDDIVTTGATLRACASVLRDAGCDRVAALVIAAD